MCFFCISFSYAQEQNEHAGQNIPIKLTVDNKRYFLPALGINLFSNTFLWLVDKYIAREDYAQISAASIKKNFMHPWVWDGDEYLTNQFGHPYQGSIYHTAARSNGFSFYESLLFDAFGSATWELIFETNVPSLNDLISTTIGGASLGEMFHRLYLEIPSPFAIIASPADALNGLITRRRPERKTTNIYSLDTEFGMSYLYTRQAKGKLEGEHKEQVIIPLRESHSFSGDVSAGVVYGNPFTLQSRVPYEHFELSVYLNFAYPWWYNFNIQSNGYLFSFNVIDNEKSMASTGLSLHYDLFTDRQINFFAESLDWTFKYMRLFSNSWNIEFKTHLGVLIFNADNSYFFDGYTDFHQKKNDYGTGTTMKLLFSAAHKKWGKLIFNSSAYEVFSVFRSTNEDTREKLFLYINLSYAYPITDHLSIGAASTVLRNTAIMNLLEDRDKSSFQGKLFVRWAY
jgi:hypothetical protein